MFFKQTTDCFYDFNLFFYIFWYSPANVDASVSFRKWEESKTGDWMTKVLNHVEDSKEDAKKDGVVVPLTVKDYTMKTRYSTPDYVDDLDDDDDDFDADDLYDEESGEDNLDYESDDDSGNEDS